MYISIVVEDLKHLETTFEEQVSINSRTHFEIKLNRRESWHEFEYKVTVFLPLKF